MLRSIIEFSVEVFFCNILGFMRYYVFYWLVLWVLIVSYQFWFFERKKEDQSFYYFKQFR